MPAYIQETGRSYPNPIKTGAFTQGFKRPASGDYDSSSDYPGVGTGMDYNITFDGGGPGSMPLGKDNVHYIGDEELTNVSNNGNERQGVYRWYRGSKDDHMYTRDPQIHKVNLGCENESWERAAKGYNPEPRKGSPVFYVMSSQVENSVPLKAWYSYWPDDTQLCVGTNTPNVTGCGRDKYLEVQTLGYVFTTEAHANAYCSPGETPKPLYEYLHPDPDHFYTTYPEKEVNLQGIAEGAPVDPARSHGKEYVYQGILCYAFQTRALDSPTDTIIDVGKIGPTGQCVNKSGWYDYTNDSQLDYDEDGGGWSEFMYRQQRDSSGASTEGPPNINGWGWPDNVDVLDNEALFEWSYGLSGAVKGAIPRYLGFEDMYDSQFVFYLYDTSNPWNGPIFSTQYILSNAQCCPNTTDPEGCPHCAPVWSYHSHFYEINADVWNTTKTKLSIHDQSSTGVNESFWTIDTETHMIFFRYLTRTGDFNSGENINGWDIVNCYYFGDELKCGVMELTWDNSRDNKWYVNPACVAWRLTTVGAVEITTSLAEKGSWVAIGAPTNTAVPWSNFMETWGIYSIKPADDATDPYIGVWQVHTATITIPSNGDYSLAIESDNYGYVKLTDSGGTVLIDRQITYASGMGSEVIPMTLAAGNYTLETRVQNIDRVVDPPIFTYQEQFTSSDGGTAEILAGYGIPNKSAFCGTYEFPKKISYWKVEIDPKALIPHRKMDEAKLEAVVGDDGTIVDVVVINGGMGYVDPIIKVMDPRAMDSFSSNDTSEFMEDKLTMDPDYNKAIGDPMKEEGYELSELQATGRKWGTLNGIINADKDNEFMTLKTAEVEISLLDERGVIKAVRVVDGGAGYNQANMPIVHVVDPEKIKYKGEGGTGAQEREAMHGKMEDAWNHKFEKEDAVYSSARVEQPQYEVATIGESMDAETMGYVKSSMGIQPQPNHFGNSPSNVYAEVPDSYIRAASDGIDDDVTKVCLSLPESCIDINAKGMISNGVPDGTQFEVMSGLDNTKDGGGIIGFEQNVMPYVYTGVKSVDTFGENMSGLYGAVGGERCITVAQPKLYNITRWFDMPCAYLAANEEGEQKAFGWLPYKYCASAQKEASFRVSMEIEGYVGGSQGPAFMEFMRNMPVPFLQQKRDIPGNSGERTWPCKRSSIDGRCYRDPQDAGNMVFVPVGLDENTYDYNRSKYTEVEQLQMWAGTNITASSAVQTWLGHPTAGDPAGTPHSVDYTAISVATCTNGVPPNECWDTYVRNITANDGPLSVYCGYDANGNPLAGQTFCQTSELYDSCVALDKVMDASIAIPPNRIIESEANARLIMGTYNGTMTVRNYLTGGVIALGRALRNYGNPYFDECSEEGSWTDGDSVNDVIEPRR